MAIAHNFFGINAVATRRYPYRLGDVVSLDSVFRTALAMRVDNVDSVDPIAENGSGHTISNLGGKDGCAIF